MAWSIGICQQCHFNHPDQYGGTHYCVFRVRRRRFSIFRWRFIREWIWICDDCDSQTTKQRNRNRSKRRGK